MKKRAKYSILLTALTLLLSLVFYAPHYLTYATPPSKSDVIIVLYGPDFRNRLTEAQRLISDSYATNIMIPAYLVKYLMTANDSLVLRDNHMPNDIAPLGNKYEGTHVELRIAREMMNKSGFHSANLVSSLYHMRRIKIIAEKVFDRGHHRLSFVPAQNVKIKKHLWFLSKYDSLNISSEYLKILWFVLYNSFAESGLNGHSSP
jgi:hypothetical protein